jgi:sulfoxide reductase heme-binding subunit YedZ
VIQTSLWLSLILPLGWIGFKFFGNGPSANPAQELTHLFGRVSIYALAINLLIGSYFWLSLQSPTVMRFFPSELRVPLKKFRRHLGVAGFLYVFVHLGFHFLIEAGIPEGFQAIAEAKYLWVGSSAFILLTTLAITSNNFSMRRMGKNWKTLHRVTYLAFALATIHTLMIEKADLIHFSFLAFVTALPLFIRLCFWASEQRKASNARR